MHNHNDDKQNSWMVWAMIICCAIPLVLILVFSAGGKALGSPPWIVLGGVAMMMIAHFFMHCKHGSHGKGDSRDHQDKSDSNKCH